jgi:hypothetical protein
MLELFPTEFYCVNNDDNIKDTFLFQSTKSGHTIDLSGKFCEFPVHALSLVEFAQHIALFFWVLG